MEAFGMVREVRQGEDWNLDILITADDRGKVPFLISNQRENACFVITVASTKYEKNLRYVKSWWNFVDKGNSPTEAFYQTVPEYVGELASHTGMSFSATNRNVTITATRADGTTYTNTETFETKLLYSYTLSTDDYDEYGEKPVYYKYIVYDKSDFTPISWSYINEYECHVRQNFSSRDTNEWTSQNYAYQITLVSGELMKDVLNSIYMSYGQPEDWPLDEEGNWETTETTEQEVITARYNYIKTRWPDALQPDIDADSPLGYIEIPEVILPPTKLQVNNNLRRLI